MNALQQSNITQLCSLIASERVVLHIAYLIKTNQVGEYNNWDNFIDSVVNFTLFQMTLSLKVPETKKIADEWNSFAERTARRITKNLVETFLLGA